MNARMRKHRIMRWLERLFVVLSLVASWGAEAAVLESVPPISQSFYCPPYSPGPCTFPTPLAALRASYAYLNISDKVIIMSCDGSILTDDISHNNICIVPVGEVRAPRQAGWGTIVICPVPTVYPKIPYNVLLVTPDSNLAVCKRTIPSALTIALSGGSEVEPSNGSTINTLPFIATVIDQNTGQPTTNPVQVHISLKVDPTSGGHDHGDSARPRGGIAGVQTCASDNECWSVTTDGNGQVVFNFNPTEISGTHTITATCQSDGCSNTATANVGVKVDGLKPIPPSGLYALYEVDGSVIGAVAGEHPSNHYLTSDAANKLLIIAINYHHLYPKDPVIYVNDASLMWGGLFDLDADWDTPHEEHRRGSVVDIRANSKAGAIPAENFDALIRLAKLSKVNAKIHNPSKTNQHFHVRLLNRSE